MCARKVAVKSKAATMGIFWGPDVAAVVQCDFAAVDDSAVHAAAVEALVSEPWPVAVDHNLSMRPRDQL